MRLLPTLAPRLPAAAALVALAACSPSQTSEKPPQPAVAELSAPSLAAAEPEGARVIVRLALHDGAISVFSSPGGPRYSLLSADGALLEAHVTAEQLRQRRPEVYEILRSSVAAGASGPSLDASIDAQSTVGRGRAPGPERGEPTAVSGRFVGDL